MCFYYEKKFDVTEDNYYDIYVKLNNIENNKANLTVKNIHEEIHETDSGITGDAIGEEDSEEGEEELVKGDDNLTWLWILIAVIVLAIIAFVIYQSQKKRK